MIKKCVVCGTEFNAKQSNYCICSGDCRRIRQQEQYVKYKLNNRERYLISARESWLRCKKPICCKICGGVVPQHIGEMRMTSKHYHEDCVVREGIQAIKEGAKCSDKRLVRAHNRYGYTITELKEIMNNEHTMP